MYNKSNNFSSIVIMFIIYISLTQKTQFKIKVFVLKNYSLSQISQKNHLTIPHKVQPRNVKKWIFAYHSHKHEEVPKSLSIFHDVFQSEKSFHHRSDRPRARNSGRDVENSAGKKRQTPPSFTSKRFQNCDWKTVCRRRRIPVQIQRTPPDMAYVIR